MSRCKLVFVESLYEADRSRRPAKVGSWSRLLGASFASVVLPLVGLAAVGGLFGERLSEPIVVAAWVAPLAAGVIAITAGLALTPTHLTSLVSGYLFGMSAGLATAMVGVLGGTWLGYTLARGFDGDRLRSAVERRPVGRLLAEAMLGGDRRRAILALTLARLPPQVPFALGNVLAASLRAPLGTLLIGTAIGMLPRVALVVWVGAALSTWDPGAGAPGALWLALGGGLVGLGGLGLWAGLCIRAFSRRSAAAAGG